MKRIVIALCTGSLLLTPPELTGTEQGILGNYGEAGVEVSAEGTTALSQPGSAENGQEVQPGSAGNAGNGQEVQPGSAGNAGSGQDNPSGNAENRQGNAPGNSGSSSADSESLPAGPEITAPSAVLLEATTGKVIYQKDADRQRRPEPDERAGRAVCGGERNRQEQSCRIGRGECVCECTGYLRSGSRPERRQWGCEAGGIHA